MAAYAKAIAAFPDADRPAKTDRIYSLYKIPLDHNNPAFENNKFANDAYSSASLLYLIYAEQGILRLNRHEYLQAMSLFYQAANRYWQDAAYVAERVLTVDELKKFVDQNAPLPIAMQKDEAGQELMFPGGKIRALLARRLMREGRSGEASPYFDDATLAEYAKQYTSAIISANNVWQSNLNRAQAWFSVATLAREHGMELLGYELSPDAKAWDGLFPFYDTPNTVSSTDQDEYGMQPDELRRAKDSEARPFIRFHYRATAANFAGKAADLLPHDSQAFAAVLCHASKWLLVREPELAAPIYQRYLKEGVYVAWGNQFGQECPAPDFELAKGNLWRKLFGSPFHPGSLGYACYLLVVLVVGGLVWRKKKVILDKIN